MDQRGKDESNGDGAVEEARILFDSAWQKLARQRGENGLRFPRKIIWLNGAPGSGKGTQTRFIMELCHLLHGPIVVSKLLTSPEAEKIKASGRMVGDSEVVGLVLEELLDPKYSNGVVVDGFPRTAVQVECLKLLHRAMLRLRSQFDPASTSEPFPQPVFHILTLFVDEAVSVARQMFRGKQNRRYNAEVRKAGIGEIKEERATDFNKARAHRRYRTFRESTFVALQNLRQVFPYHHIDGHGPIREVGESIATSLGNSSPPPTGDGSSER